MENSKTFTFNIYKNVDNDNGNLDIYINDLTVLVLHNPPNQNDNIQREITSISRGGGLGRGRN